MLETHNLTVCMSVLVNLIRRQVSIKAPIFLWCLVSVILDDIKYRRDRELEEFKSFSSVHSLSSSTVMWSHPWVLSISHGRKGHYLQI